MTIRIAIKATNIEMTPAIERYVREKIGSLEKFIDQSDTTAIADVEVGTTTHRHQQGEIFRAEVNLSLHGDLLRAVSTQTDLYAAIDDVRDELIASLRKKKTKRLDFIRRGGARLKAFVRGFSSGNNNR